jgi:hypothetical protein
MQTSNEFLSAKKDKNVRSLIIKLNQDRQYMYLCIDTPIRYTDNKETVYIESDTTIRIDNYSSSFGKKIDIKKICFHLSVWNDNFVRCFINAIKKDSNVFFKVVAFNQSENINSINWVSHQLYGIIDNKEYFLSDYTGANNSASPISY